MKSASLVLLAALMLLSAGCAGQRVPAAPHVWQLRGAVVDVQESTIRVRHKSGQEVVLVVDERTHYWRDKQPTSLALLKPGALVLVDVERVPDGEVALRVEIFGGD